MIRLILVIVTYNGAVEDTAPASLGGVTEIKPLKKQKETVMKKYAESKGFFDFKAERELYSIVKAW